LTRLPHLKGIRLGSVRSSHLQCKCNRFRAFKSPYIIACRVNSDTLLFQKRRCYGFQSQNYRIPAFTLKKPQRLDLEIMIRGQPIFGIFADTNSRQMSRSAKSKMELNRLLNLYSHLPLHPLVEQQSWMTRAGRKLIFTRLCCSDHQS